MPINYFRKRWKTIFFNFNRMNKLGIFVLLFKFLYHYTVLLNYDCYFLPIHFSNAFLSG